MISKQIAVLAHMTCQCGRHPRVMQVEDRYYVEAICCKTVTVRLRTGSAAVNEFQRIRGVQHADACQSDKVTAIFAAAEYGEAQAYFKGNK